MTKSSKLFKCIIIVIILIALIFLVRKLVIIQSVFNTLEEGVTVNPFSYYENPQDSINEALNYSKDIGDDEKIYHYKAQIFQVEDDNNYIEFFIADDDYTVWYIVLDKQRSGDVTKYRAENYKNNVQLDKYEWVNIIDNKSYIVVDNKDKIEEVDEKDAKVIPFSIDTKQGKTELYLLYLEK